ncbi:PRC-barrel domain-containing protein [Halobacillus litoralis]|uniref:PRC-barrel domain-containing protein n=1 Tax=Halobacillus litoralis TaxID=45668 RepID=UPI001CD65D3D|nr:PRC-barrel domain-containing protein [Halobacillus litoralis]MCA0970737.1 PRC-barrel domain-containing protein [Halobacillus litoralis]
MIHNERFIEDYTIDAEDAELGKVDAFLFDDEKWAVRYLAADTRKWLPGRKVLISPISIEKINHDANHISVHLTKEQVKESPDIDTDQPVSREQEARMNLFFGWGNYWGEPGIWGPGFYPSEVVQQEMIEMTEEQSEESHVRKTSEIEGYHVRAKDGVTGKVESFLIDDETWKIRYVIVKMEDADKKVLLPSEQIVNVSWAEQTIQTAAIKEAFNQAPAYHPDVSLTPDYEEQIKKAYRN